VSGRFLALVCEWAQVRAYIPRRACECAKNVEKLPGAKIDENEDKSADLPFFVSCPECANPDPRKGHKRRKRRKEKEKK